MNALQIHDPMILVYAAAFLYLAERVLLAVRVVLNGIWEYIKVVKEL